MLSIMFIWGCSQAQDQAVTEAKAEAKEVVTEQVEAVKVEAMDQAKELASDIITATTNDAVSETKESVDMVADKMVKPAAYQAGIHYQVINPAYKTNAGEEVVVYEFFGYTCPHCATFEPYMKKLEAELPEKAKLVRVPVVFGKQWEPFAQAYYTFEAMGITDQAHEPMFQAIHQHKKQFRSIDEIAVWAASSFGIDKEEFLSTAKSFMVDGQVRNGMQMLEAMGVTSTPTLVTNGKFVPNSKALKTRNDLIEVTKFLVNQELDAMKP